MITPAHFSGVRAAKLLFKQTLEIVDEIRVENDVKIAELKKTLEGLEKFIKKEHNISVSLVRFADYTNVLTEAKVAAIRKRVLDTGNALIREIESQS